jgi:hypothetical protein
MALDEPNDTDESFDVDGYKYIVNKEFMEKAQPIKVDFHAYGFKLDCNMDFGSGCTSCGTQGSCCS